MYKMLMTGMSFSATAPMRLMPPEEDHADQRGDRNAEHESAASAALPQPGLKASMASFRTDDGVDLRHMPCRRKRWLQNAKQNADPLPVLAETVLT